MPLNKHFLLGRCMKQLRGKCFNLSCRSAVVVTDDILSRATFEPCERLRWRDFRRNCLNEYLTTLMVIPIFCTAHSFISCTHTSTVMYKTFQVFREIGKLRLSPQRAWRPMLFCLFVCLFFFHFACWKEIWFPVTYPDLKDFYCSGFQYS